MFGDGVFLNEDSVTRILQISDTHIVSVGAKAYDQVNTSGFLAQAVSAIRDLNDAVGGIDAVFVTGDLVDTGTVEEYVHFRAILSAVNLPLLLIPGNHDDAIVLQETLMPESEVGRHLNWAQSYPDLLVIGLDSSVSGADHGHLSDATLGFLDKTLPTAQGRPILLGMHHPPFTTGIDHMDRIGLHNPERLENSLKGHDGPVQIISGHVHRHIATAFAGKAAMICPSTAHSVALRLLPDDPASFSEEPGGMVLHCSDGAQVTSYQYPVADYSGPHRF